jgi:hypothetical protein
MHYLLLSLLSWATPDSCPKADFSSRLGEVRDQGYIGSCYAQAAADLVTYETGTRISASHISLAAVADDGLVETTVKDETSGKEIACGPKKDMTKSISLLEGGHIPETIAEVSKIGFCSEKEFPSGDAYYYAVSSTVDSLFTHPYCDKHFDMGIYFSMKSLAPLTSKGQALKMLASKCSDKIFLKKEIQSLSHGFNEVSPKSRKEILQKTHELLEKKQIAAVYVRPVESLMKDSWEDLLKSLGCDGVLGSPHSMVVVGREFNQAKNRCEFKVRNSWGKDCTQYDEKFRCEDGYVWMSEQDYMELVFAVEWLQ